MKRIGFVMSEYIIPEHIQAMLDERERTMATFTDDYRPLNMYAIYRTDLYMDSHKLGAQLGHAYVNAWDNAKVLRPELASQYKGTGNGTKIVMYGKNVRSLIVAYDECKSLGIPCDLIIDRGHIYLPHFDGRPIITALGIGPAYQDEVAHITKKFTMIKKEIKDIVMK
jgi:peptidyl-tRNA hydrolase, PTH2 family